MSLLQFDRKSLQPDLQEAAPFAAVFAFAAAIYLLAGLNALILSILGGIGVWKFFSAQQALKEAQARASSFANICGPIVVRSAHCGETAKEVTKRAEYFREQMELCGNPWYKDIPIIEYPYAPMMFESRNLTMAWNIYMRNADARQHEENLRWADHCPMQLRAIFLTQVLGQNMQQV